MYQSSPQKCWREPTRSRVSTKREGKVSDPTKPDVNKPLPSLPTWKEFDGEVNGQRHSVAQSFSPRLRESDHGIASKGLSILCYKPWKREPRQPSAVKEPSPNLYQPLELNVYVDKSTQTENTVLVEKPAERTRAIDRPDGTKTSPKSPKTVKSVSKLRERGPQVPPWSPWQESYLEHSQDYFALSRDYDSVQRHELNPDRSRGDKTSQHYSESSGQPTSLERWDLTTRDRSKEKSLETLGTYNSRYSLRDSKEEVTPKGLYDDSAFPQVELDNHDSKKKQNGTGEEGRAYRSQSSSGASASIRSQYRKELRTGRSNSLQLNNRSSSTSAASLGPIQDEYLSTQDTTSARPPPRVLARRQRRKDRSTSSETSVHTRHHHRSHYRSPRETGYLDDRLSEETGNASMTDTDQEFYNIRIEGSEESPTGGLLLDVPDHLPLSPLCPQNIKSRSGVSGICPLHGQRKSSGPEPQIPPGLTPPSEQATVPVVPAVPTMNRLMTLIRSNTSETLKLGSPDQTWADSEPLVNVSPEPGKLGTGSWHARSRDRDADKLTRLL